MNRLQTFAKRAALLFATVLLLLPAAACGTARKEDRRGLDPFAYSLLNLSGTDAVGRQVTPAAARRSDAVYVGLWYSFWEGQHPSLQPEIKDIQKLLDLGEEGRAVLADQSDYAQFYYWGEPLYGYYDMRDPFVITRHIELFLAADIDFLCVDVTNMHDYLEVGETFLGILSEFQRQGFRVPKICFYTNTNSGTTVDRVYHDYYESGKWESLWFKPNGKPLIVGITENNFMASDQTRFWGSTDYVSRAMQNYFEVKESQWPNGIYNENGMPWMSWKYPQEVHGGYAAVPVAQHDPVTTYFSTMSPPSSRGYDNVSKRVSGDWREGLSFQQMWNSVLERKDEITTVFVCCWNEWIAQKQSNGAFIDVYNWEYSRDIEMMKGGYGDNFYMQLVESVRAFKLTEPEHYVYPQREIDVSGPFGQWEGVPSHYKDFYGDALPRNFKRAAGAGTYIDDSARNDITDIKVAHDAENLYFYVRTGEDITTYNGTDENWMNLFLRTGASGRETFEGYQFLVNRRPGEGKTSVERSKGGYTWEQIGAAALRVEGREMMLAVPLDALGLSAENCLVEFKVSDHVTNYRDIMDYYVTGDSAPIGRLNYCYGY